MCGCVFLWVVSPNSTATVACGQEKDQQAVATNMEPENAPPENEQERDRQTTACSH